MGLSGEDQVGDKFLNPIIRKYTMGDIDYLIIDFPRTGDIQLTTMQKLNLSGINHGYDSQDIAVNDARKAASMFNNPELAIPIL